MIHCFTFDTASHCNGHVIHSTCCYYYTVHHFSSSHTNAYTTQYLYFKMFSKYFVGRFLKLTVFTLAWLAYVLTSSFCKKLSNTSSSNSFTFVYMVDQNMLSVLCIHAHYLLTHNSYLLYPSWEMPLLFCVSQRLPGAFVLILYPWLIKRRGWS